MAVSPRKNRSPKRRVRKSPTLRKGARKSPKRSPRRSLGSRKSSKKESGVPRLLEIDGTAFLGETSPRALARKLWDEFGRTREFEGVGTDPYVLSWIPLTQKLRSAGMRVPRAMPGDVVRFTTSDAQHPKSNVFLVDSPKPTAKDFYLVPAAKGVLPIARLVRQKRAQTSSYDERRFPGFSVSLDDDYPTPPKEFVPSLCTGSRALSKETCAPKMPLFEEFVGRFV